MAKIKHDDVGVGLETAAEWAGENLHEVLDNDGLLLISNPPSTYHKIYNIYAEKIGIKYHLRIVVETEPEP